MAPRVTPPTVTSQQLASAVATTAFESVVDPPVDAPPVDAVAPRPVAPVLEGNPPVAPVLPLEPVVDRAVVTPAAKTFPKRNEATSVKSNTNNNLIFFIFLRLLY